MILTNRLFERNLPSREAKSIYIFCEGAKREYQYFKYFREKDSRINVEIYKLHHHEDNSPLGLLSIAKKSILKSEENPNPKFSFQENDEVWIVLDTDKDKNDSRKEQIKIVRQECSNKKDWFTVESNPCFEVWLYYHKNDQIPNLKDNQVCKSWKELVNNSFEGGFDSRRHPIFIEEATKNAQKNYSVNNENIPIIGTTGVFNLSKSILSLLANKIREVKKRVSL